MSARRSLVGAVASVAVAAAACGDGLPEPCARVALADTAGWVRHPMGRGSVLLPADYRPVEGLIFKHGGVRWTGASGTFDAMAVMGARAPAQGVRACETRIDGRRVRMEIVRGPGMYELGLVPLQPEPEPEGFRGYGMVYIWRGASRDDLRTFMGAMHHLRLGEA